MRTANVMPAPGRRVRLADGSVVPASGRRVAVDLHVWRAIAAGDLIEQGAATAAAPAAATTKPANAAQAAPATASAPVPAAASAPVPATPPAAAEEKSK